MYYSKQVADQFLRIQKAKERLRTNLNTIGIPTSDTDTLDTIADKVTRYTPPSIVPIRTNNLFIGNSEMTIAPALSVDKKQNTDLTSTFRECTSLLKIPYIDKLEDATSLYYFAYNCKQITEATLPDMPVLTSLNRAFCYCASLTSLSVGALPKVTDMGYFASDCDLRGDFVLPDLPEATTIEGVVYKSRNLRSLTIGNAPRCNSLYNLCSGCENLEEITLGEIGSVTGNKLTRLQYAFSNCYKLRRINGILDLSAINNNNNWTDGCFSGCSKLSHLRIKGLNVDSWLTNLPALDLESATYIVENLTPQTGKTLTLRLSKTLLTTLGDEAIGDLEDKATALGWTLKFE